MPTFTPPATFNPGIVTAAMMNRINTMIAELQFATNGGELLNRTATSSATTSSASTVTKTITGWHGEVLTLANTRRLQVFADPIFVTSAATANCNIRVDVGGGAGVRAIDKTWISPPAASTELQMLVSRPFTLPAGQYTIGAVITKNAGATASLTVSAGFLTIEDLGAA